MPPYPAFRFPSPNVQANSAFSPAQIDFTQISRIADSYYGAKNDALRREAAQDELSSRREEAARDAQFRQMFAQGIPKDAQGNLDLSAAADRLIRMGDPKRGLELLGAANQEADRRHSRAFDEKKFAADEAYRRDSLGVQRDQVIPATVREYQFYAKGERAAGREPIPFGDFTHKKNASDAPSNVREWMHFQSLTPEQQQQYLTMKRADKYLDTGTEFVRPNPVVPGQTVSTVPKNVAERKAQEAVGSARGTAQAALPTALNAAERMLATIDAIDNDRNLEKVTGLVGGRIPEYLQTPAMAETQSRLNQIQGQTFLQAYNDLRGAGQITEREGMAAQSAYNRLTTQTMGTKAYREALREFRNEVLQLVDIAKQRAGVSGTGPSPTSGDPTSMSNDALLHALGVR